MKLLKYNIIAILLTVLTLGMNSCVEADPEFVHEDNFISAMVCMSGRTNASPTLNGTVYEYDKNGMILQEGFTAEDAAGGSGVIVFIVDRENHDKFDLTDVFLRATVTYDAFIYPTLSGKHNILVTEENPEGKVFAVKSGTGVVRKYRVMGIYE